MNKSNKLNILFVSSEFPLSKSQNTGGIGTYLLNLSEGLVKKGHQVTIITKDRGKYQYNNLKVVPINSSGINCLKKALKFKLALRILNFFEYPLFFSLGAYFKIRELEQKIDLDLIEGSDFGGELFFYFLLAKKRLPVVLRLHTPSFVIQKYNNENPNLFYKIMKFLEIYCLKKADSLYSPTESLAKIISAIVKRKVDKIIPYPFKPIYSFSKVKRKDNIILFVGKIQPKKGVFTLIKTISEILKKIPDIKLYFAGPDTLQNGKSVKLILREASDKLGISDSIKFFGELNKRELYKVYRQATITVIPSLWENFPNVCLEAMSLDCPVIVSRTGGLTEIIKDEVNGLSFTLENEKELAQKIGKLLKNERLRNKISYNARKTIDNLYLLTIAEKTIEYYKKTIKDK